MNEQPQKIILAFVGMPGSGKSEAVLYLKEKGYPFVRFGELTDNGLKQMNLPINPENEQMFREKIRQEIGMAAYAIKAEPKILELLEKNTIITIDGLYSWEEYLYLKEKFPNLFVIHVFAERQKRYERLSKRKIRPIPFNKCYQRDVTEIEKLNKGGPIALADYLIENNTDFIPDLYLKIENLLQRLKIK